MLGSVSFSARAGSPLEKVATTWPLSTGSPQSSARRYDHRRGPSSGRGEAVGQSGLRQGEPGGSTPGDGPGFRRSRLRAGERCDNNVYCITGNGTFDASTNGDWGDTFLKLSTTNGLKVADFFTPYNQAALSAADLDLGSGGAVVLPDDVGGGTTNQHLIVGAGKEGTIYLINGNTCGNTMRTTARSWNRSRAPSAAF